MRFDPEFGRLLALALSIHMRDEVAVQQFAAQIARDVTLDVETDQALASLRSGSEDQRQERMAQRMQDRLIGLRALVDANGLAWLRQMLPA